MQATRTGRCCSVLVVIGVLASVSVRADEPKVPADHVERAKAGTKLFQEQVRSLLTEHCLDCHGGKSTKADFDLATREALIASGHVGNSADDSYLMQLIRHEEEPGMPLKADKLPDEAIAAIAKWIDLGAPYDKPLVEASASAGEGMQITDDDREYWSFRRLVPVEVPDVDDGVWVRNPIDRFMLARFEQQGLQPAPEAERRTLLRRASLDLLGLPPTPDEVDAFESDADPGAYDRLIDRLLESDHYGERWARHWMDVARFAESDGFEHDYDRPTAYHYRDFLIEAFNRDVPWDDMVRWQIAGDELAPENPLAWQATGFLASGVFPTQLTEVEFEPARYDQLDDMVGTLGVAFLGLSTGCARCHDHKFDPIPTRDYYRMVAAFGAAIPTERPVRAQTAVFEREHAAWDAQRESLQQALDEAADDQQEARQKALDEHLQTEPIDGRLPAIVCSEGLPPLKHQADGRGFPHFYPEVFYLKRGDVKQKDGVAEAGFLQVLMSAESDSSDWQFHAPSESGPSYRRAALARWITDSEQGAGHLLARVIVNRLWQHHFGRGIVATPNDFGIQGATPTHPELLDWLARYLIAQGWQLKPVHQLILTSATYRQGASGIADQTEIDAENRWLWHFPARRLEGEAIRDSMLAVSGLLDPTMGGPSTLDESMRRRSVYFMVKRSKPIPFMQVFDWPEHLVSIGARPTTTIAPQALALMNSPQVREYADAFARRVRPDTGTSADDVIRAAYRLALSRDPMPSETEQAVAFLRSQTVKYADAADPQHQAVVDFCQALLGSNEFLYLP